MKDRLEILKKLTQEQGRTPTDKEIADSMQISISEVEHLKTYSQSISSLDAPANEDTDTTLGEGKQNVNCMRNLK